MRFCLLLIFLFSTCFAAAQPQVIHASRINGYQITNERLLEEDVNFFVLADTLSFLDIFSPIIKSKIPDFSKHWFIAIALPPQQRDYQMTVNKVSYKAGNFIEIYIGIDRKGGKLSYTNYPISTVLIPKYDNIEVVNFYESASLKKVGSVDVKIRKPRKH